LETVSKPRGPLAPRWSGGLARGEPAAFGGGAWGVGSGEWGVGSAECGVRNGVGSLLKWCADEGVDGRRGVRHDVGGGEG
jgi:hypothetical protein